MATKTYRARIVNADERLRDALDRTHMIFVRCLAQMIQRYLDMKNGKYGSEAKQLVEILLDKSNTFAHGVMDQLSRPQVTSGLDADWVELAKEYHRQHGPMFLQADAFAVVDGIEVHTKSHGKADPVPGRLPVTAKFWHQVCDSASAFIKSYYALLEEWRKERKQWLAQREEWQQEHPEFMSFRNGPYQQFLESCEQARVEFQKAAGQQPTIKRKDKNTSGKKFSRWHLWYEWIVARPEIIEWRGKAKREDFRLVPEEEQQKIRLRNPRQDKQVSKFLNWLIDNNPELKALEALRKQYMNQFRSFRKPPTFTIPSPQKHPYWFTFELGEMYRNVDFEKGSIKLCLIDRDDSGILSLRWFDAQFSCDPRLRPSWRGEKFRTEGRFPPFIQTKNAGRILGKAAESAEDRKAGYAGAKLYIRQSRKELLFTVIEQDCPQPVRWTKVKDRKCPADNVRSPEGERVPLKVLSIDLGIRRAAAFAVGTGTWADDSWQVQWEKKGFLQGDSAPSLMDIRRHDRVLRKQRSRQGRAPRGERTFADFQDHRTDMADDRFKKVANAIIETARRHRVHLILFENLSSLLFTAYDERWMNRQLRDMNRRQIVTYVKPQAQEFGILCDDEISPWMTSKVCSRCFRPGWRFSMKQKEPVRAGVLDVLSTGYGYPIWEPGGHLFRCPHCGYRVHADLNAAGNIGAKFFGLGFWSGFKYKDGTFSWQENGDLQSFCAKDEFEVWASQAKQRKAMQETPF